MSCEADCQSCVESCEACIAACLKEGGREACIQACRDCIDACEVADRLARRKSPLAAAARRFCEEACFACAAECEKHDDEACRACAASCRACATSCGAAWADSARGTPAPINRAIALSSTPHVTGLMNPSGGGGGNPRRRLGGTVLSVSFRSSCKLTLLSDCCSIAVHDAIKCF